MTDRDEPALPEPRMKVKIGHEVGCAIYEPWPSNCDCNGRTASYFTTDQLRTYAAECGAPLRAEIERLTAALKKANDQAEHFEREWYLRGDALAAAEADASQAAHDVLAERRRQIEVESWTPEHDDQHHDGSMALAAACYASNAATWASHGTPRLREKYSVLSLSFRWPWSPDWWKPKSQRQDLVRAGALILAEIERLDRAAQKEKP